MRILKLTLITLIFSIQLTAQTAEDAVNLLEDEQGFGLRAMALGNAYTALANDYSAIYYNPAGLADVKVGQFSASLSNFNRQTDADFLGSSFSEDLSSTKFQSLGLVFPFPVVRGSFVMALGYQKIKDYENYLKIDGYNQDNNSLDFLIENDYGQSYYYGFDEQLYQRSNLVSDGNLSQWSFGMAMDFSPNFSGGFSLNLYDGNRNDNFQYSQDTLNSWNSWYMDETASPTELRFVYYKLQQKLKSEFSGFSAKVGAVLDIIPEQLKVGVAIDFPIHFKVDEKWSVSDDLGYDIIRGDDIDSLSGSYQESGNFDYLINIPFKFDVGISFKKSIFLVTASLSYRDWSQLKYDIPNDRPRENYDNLINQNQYFRDEFTAVTTYSIGGEVSLLNDRIKLRGGFKNVPSPLKELGADYNKQYISGGLGYQIDKSTIIHLTYVRGSWQGDKYYYYDAFDDDGAAPLVTSEDYVTTKILVGAQFNFR
ncbi:MAG: outer membrane protein transport protein [Calditrichaceae bacterium]|nr:outer membrane protein transport protein [Calditrichaceae bacterium]